MITPTKTMLLYLIFLVVVVASSDAPLSRSCDFSINIDTKLSQYTCVDIRDW